MARSKTSSRASGSRDGRVSRREMLAASGALIAGTLTARPAAALADTALTDAPLTDAAVAEAVQTSTAPAAAAAQAGGSEAARVRMTLDCRWLDRKFPDGTRVRLRSYNGQVPGPKISTKPGGVIAVRVRNQLTPYDSAGWNGDHNVPHALNTTNLHLHGLDIRPHLFQPVGTSDPLAKMIAIPPGTEYDYEFELPHDHPPGLYWYHPHHHGSTAVQAASGMAGPIIVYGDIDEVPAIKAARDIPLVIQDLGLFPSDRPGESDIWTYEPKQNAIWQTFNSNVTIWDPKTKKNVVQPLLKGGFSTGDYLRHYYLINGEPFFREDHNPAQGQQTKPTTTQMGVPRYEIAPGEVVRFRMLNGCSDNLMPIVVEGHPMYLIAMDGVNYPAPRVMPAPSPSAPTPTPQVLLAPANRAEFLIKGSATPGTYRIMQLAQNQQFIASAQKVIAEIVVRGTPKNMPLPDKLPPPSRYYPLMKPEQVTGTRTFQFVGTFPAVMNPYVGGDFSINNTLYEERAVPTVVELEDVEDWQVEVLGPHHGGSEGHPFHVHVNHFEVISIGGVAQPPGTIQDTIWVPEKTTVVIRMKFKQYAGKAVYHCHILPHEDTGMMGNFLILSPAHGGAAPTKGAEHDAE